MQTIRSKVAAALLAPLLLASCALSTGSRRAEHPASRAGLAQYPVTVDDPALAAALVANGFAVVDHAPYQGALLLTVKTSATSAIATLTSDGFFVDRVEMPLPLDADAMARDFATSERVAELVRNGGTVQQTDIFSQ